MIIKIMTTFLPNFLQSFSLVWKAETSALPNSVVLFDFFTRQVAEIQILFFEPRFFVNLDMVAMVAHEKKEVLQIIYYQYQKFDTNFDNNPCCTD